jgi:hypothetical protein
MAEPIDINGPTTARVTPMPSSNPVPSLIKIPNQLAVTFCWVGLGIAIGYYICHKSSQTRPQRRNSVDA